MRNLILAAGASLAALGGCAGVGPGGEAAPSSFAADEAGPVSASLEETLRDDYGADPWLIARFAPAPSNDRRIDYAVIDEALDMAVFNAGPSLRRRQRFPAALAGSRLVRGHVSPYRLEGNKVFFSQFDDEVLRSLGEYRESLQAIGAGGRVQSLPRNEQLAYWYNLHNLVVIDEIANQYPLRYPREATIGSAGEVFHRAKVVALGAETLSLRDIREIVYAHWDDPKVMYGFYLGDVGGPSIRPEAYAGADIAADLNQQARRFVNSLRGVSRGGGNLYVSAFYDEGRDHFFPDWPGDLTRHLAEHADEEVAGLLAQDRPVRFGQYEDRIADMAGGEVMSDLGVRGGRGTGQVGNSRVSPTMLRMAVEYREKLDELREEGYLKGRVIIVDIPTDDPDEAGDAEVR